MKTYSQFGESLMNGDNVYFTNGKGLVVNFYPCLKVGSTLVTVCVEFKVRLENSSDSFWHTSSSVVTDIEAYKVFETLLSSL